MGNNILKGGKNNMNKILIVVLLLMCFPLINALELGAESVTCWDFSCENGWNINNESMTMIGIYPSSKVLVFQSQYYPAIGNISQDINVQPGSVYKVELSVGTTWFDWHDFWIELGGNKSNVFTDEGVYNFNLTAIDDSNFTIVVNRTLTGAANAYVIIDSLSAKEYIEPMKLTFRFLNKEFTVDGHDKLTLSLKNNNFIVEAHNKLTLKYLIRKLRWLWR